MLWQKVAIGFAALFLFGGALSVSAADLKVEIFYRGLLAEHPSEWAELLVLAPKDSGFPFDMKIADPPGPIPAQPGVSFGALVRVGNIPNEITTLKVKQVLRHPPMTLPDGSVVTQREERMTVPVSVNAVGLVLDFQFVESHELVEGTWVLEAYLDETTLFCIQRFRVVAGAVAPVQPELGTPEGEAMFALSRARYLAARAMDADASGALPDPVWNTLEPALNREWGRFRTELAHQDRAASMPPASSRAAEAAEAADAAPALPVWFEDLRGLDDYLRQPGGKVALDLARSTVRELPDGAVVFGGTDFGRFVLEAARVVEQREDIVLICQHQLVRPDYRAWVDSRFSGQLTLPDETEVEAAMLAYAKEFVPDEVLARESGLEFVGYTHMVEIGSRLARLVFEANTNRTMFVEERFPMDWMRERMRPGPGLLMRLDREPVSAWSAEELASDSSRWAETVLAVSGSAKRTAIRPSLLHLRGVTRDVLERQGLEDALARVKADLLRLSDPVTAELFGLAPVDKKRVPKGLQTYRFRRHKQLLK